jgi:glycosyltransferase involved in cell wall biosynthesis
MTKIFIAHPRTQHSQQLALALYENNYLEKFVSGVPVLDENESAPFWMPKYYAKRLKKISIPKKYRYHPLLIQCFWFLSRYVPAWLFGEKLNYYIFYFFDWYVSKIVCKLKPDVVIAFEDSAYLTFLAAKSIGAKCVLDAPSLHHVAGAKYLKVDKTDFLDKVNNRKDKELILADLILTCSPVAAEGYIDAGVSPENIKYILLGATLPNKINKWEIHLEPLRFLFAGVLSKRKSIDIILEVFKRLNSENLEYELTFIGGEGEIGWINKISSCPNAKYFPGVAQVELFDKLSHADCLLLPSRFDSFGMVVAEAMACGTPAIVSTKTGAKAMIEKYPGSGWIVDCNVDSLYNCIKDLINNRNKLFAAREVALHAAKDFTWSAYRENVGKELKNWLRV